MGIRVHMNAKVLLVDDSSTTLLMEEMLFRKYTKYEVLTARDGMEAVEKTAAERPNLVLMDVVMPKMDGYAACREIRKQPELRNIPIILVTSRGEECSVETGFESGCNDYLTKPVNTSELFELVHFYLGS
jgi:CheY-like chemotaxis protein